MSQPKPERARHVEWHGTLREQLDLIAAVQHNCACIVDDAGGPHTVCAGHRMYANDQRALDGLLWNRHLVARLRSEEGIGVR